MENFLKDFLHEDRVSSDSFYDADVLIVDKSADMFVSLVILSDLHVENTPSISSFKPYSNVISHEWCISMPQWWIRWI